jgi:hypothetical protein
LTRLLYEKHNAEEETFGPINDDAKAMLERHEALTAEAGDEVVEEEAGGTGEEEGGDPCIPGLKVQCQLPCLGTFEWSSLGPAFHASKALSCRVDVWDTVECRKITGNAAPMVRNLKKYLRMKLAPCRLQRAGPRG